MSGSGVSWEDGLAGAVRDGAATIPYPTSWSGSLTVDDFKFTRESEESEESEVAISHIDPQMSDEGEWTCGFCDAESFDKELFNDAGQTNMCVDRGLAAGLSPRTKKTKKKVREWADTSSAIKWIEEANKITASMKSLEEDITKTAFRSGMDHTVDALLSSLNGLRESTMKAQALIEARAKSSGVGIVPGSAYDSEWFTSAVDKWKELERKERILPPLPPPPPAKKNKKGWLRNG